MKEANVNRLLDIGIALTSEKDPGKLLLTILEAAMEITNCDGGTLYIKESDSLCFRMMITKSMDVFRGPDDEITLPPVPLSKSNVCACSAIGNELINIPDVYENSAFDFSGPMKYDSLTGFKTTSMLVVPMDDNYGDVIGVLQLINALDENGQVIPFDGSLEPVIRSLASQAAIALTNVNYLKEISELFDSFVKVMSTAIDERSPYNANHTRNMVNYAGRFIDWLNERGEWRFDEAKRREFLMSVWLHDVGKLVIPLEIMDKSSRLGSRLEHMLARFENITLLNRIALLEGKITRDEYDNALRDVSKAANLVEKVNRAGFMSDEDLAEVDELSQMTYRDRHGKFKPFITEDEHQALRIRKGTLTKDERNIIEGHAPMAAKMLSQIKFSRDYANVPLWAAAHHEFLNGGGYPQKLTELDIPKEVRLLTILDIFDALTARDRPYKPAMPLEKALSILDSMAEDGQIDGGILKLFVESRAWEEYLDV